jgi:hypothetical protein
VRTLARVFARATRLDLPLTLAVLAGVALRVDQLLDQIPLDDEWHALHNIVRYDYGWLLTHFGWTDFCIPLALYDRLIADTIGLSELWLRAPILLCGVAALILFPLAIRPWIGRSASQVFAWLLALSPLHVFFSRFARPYGITLTLAFLGALAFFSWWSAGRRRDAVIFASCAIVGPLFHLSVLPVLLAPLVCAPLVTAVLRVRSASTPSWRRLACVALTVALGLLLVLGPPLALSFKTLAYKGSHGTLVASSWLQGLALLSGVGLRSLAYVAAALAVAGYALIWRAQRVFALYLGLVSLSAPVLVLLTRPTMIDWPIVLVRYCLLCLPVLLALVALAFARLGELIRSRWPFFPGVAPGIACCVTVFAFGPLPRIHYRPNNWTNHGTFQYAYVASPAEAACPRRISHFYERLARLPSASTTIVEAPWWFGWETIPFPCYQHLHRQRMLIGFVGPRDPARPNLLPRPGELPENGPGARFRFRSFVHVDDAQGLRDRGVRYVIFHRDLERELPHLATALNVDVSDRIQEYRARYGPAVYKDDLLVVFDVSAPTSGVGKAPPAANR